MDLHIEYFEQKAFRDEIARTRNELVILRRSLDANVETCRVHNSVAVSIRRDIDEHEKLLRSSEQKLSEMTH